MHTFREQEQEKIEIQSIWVLMIFNSKLKLLQAKKNKSRTTLETICSRRGFRVVIEEE